MRYFPSAARTRALVTAAVVRRSLLSALAGPSVPLRPSRTPTTCATSRRDVQHQIKQAQHEAEEASKAVAARDRGRSTAAQAELAGARSWLVTVRGKLAEARAEDARMAARLEARPAAGGPGSRGRGGRQGGPGDAARGGQGLGGGGVPDGRARVAGAAGLPQLRVPDRPDPAAGVHRHRRRGRGDRVRRPARRRGAAGDPRGRGRGGRARGGRPAPRRRRAPARDRGPARAGEVREARGDRPGRPAPRGPARRVAGAPPRPGGAREAEEAEKQIKQQILAAAAADKGPGYVGSSDGFLLAPTAGSVTSPFGYRTHPIYGYYGLHDGIDIGAGCGSALRAAAARHGDLVVLRLGLRQPALPQRRQGQRPQPHRGLQPRHRATGSASARTSRAAPPSGTSARPAGRPAATCTSRCCATATPVDPMGYL